MGNGLFLVCYPREDLKTASQHTRVYLSACKCFDGITLSPRHPPKSVRTADNMQRSAILLGLGSVRKNHERRTTLSYKLVPLVPSHTSRGDGFICTSNQEQWTNRKSRYVRYPCFIRRKIISRRNRRKGRANQWKNSDAMTIACLGDCPKKQNNQPAGMKCKIAAELNTK